jgi:hypothetical protein
MRISVLKDDPDYHENHIFAEVLLDGSPVKDCVTADDTKGEVVCYQKTLLGVHILEDDEPRFNTFTGEVSINLNGPWKFIGEGSKQFVEDLQSGKFEQPPEEVN